VAAIPPGRFNFGVNVVLPELASQVPRMLRLSKKMQITDGRLSFAGEAGKSEDKLFIGGKLLISDLKGTSRSKTYALSEPVVSDFLVTRTERMLEIPRFTFSSSFADFSARGTEKQIVITGRYDLAKMFFELSSFVDFGVVQLAGVSNNTIEIAQNQPNVFEIKSFGTLENFKISGLPTGDIADPSAVLSLHALVDLQDRDAHFLDIKNLTWTSAQMKLQAETRISNFDSGERKVDRFEGTVESELSFLTALAAGMLPKGLRLSGRLNWKGQVTPTADALAFSQKLDVSGLECAYDGGQKKVSCKSSVLELESKGTFAGATKKHKLTLEEARLKTDFPFRGRQALRGRWALR